MGVVIKLNEVKRCSNCKYIASDKCYDCFKYAKFKLDRYKYNKDKKGR